MASVRSILALGSAALSLTILVGCASTNDEVLTSSAAYPAFSTSAELATSADLIVRGVTLSSHTEKKFMEQSIGGDQLTNPQAGLPKDEQKRALEDSYVVTISTVRVDEVLKGKATVGDTVEVSQLGGKSDGVQYQDEGTRLLEIGHDSYLLFLAAHGSGKPYDLPNPGQAMYSVGANGTLTPAIGENTLHINNIQDVKADLASAR